MNFCGTLFVVGTGPFGADFLTLKAKRILENVNTIFYPKTENATRAFDCVCEAVDVSQKKCVPFYFPMKQNESEFPKIYEKTADLICDVLKNEDATIVTIGDAPLFSTATRVCQIVKKRGFFVESVAGVSSVSAAMNALLLPFSFDKIHTFCGDKSILDGSFDSLILADGLKIIMKTSRFLAEICEKIVQNGLASKSYLVWEVSSSNEKIVFGKDFLSIPKEILEKPYMSIIFVGEK